MQGRYFVVNSQTYLFDQRECGVFLPSSIPILICKTHFFPKLLVLFPYECITAKPRKATIARKTPFLNEKSHIFLVFLETESLIIF